MPLETGFCRNFHICVYFWSFVGSGRFVKVDYLLDSSTTHTKMKLLLSPLCHQSPGVIRVWWYISKFIIIIIIFIIHHCFDIWRCENHHNQDIQLKAWEPLRLEQLLEQGNSVPEKCSTRRPLLWSLHAAWPASHDISHLVRSLWDKVKLTLFQGATSLWLTENSAAKQRGIIPNGMTLWQTQYPWWTQCPPLFLNPLSSVRPSRSC